MEKANVSQLSRVTPSTPVIASHLDQQIPQYLQGAAILICLLIGGLGGWAAIASISGAVVAQASVAAQTKTNVIQHLDGGVVAELFVKERDLVAAGQLLVRLDRTEVDEELRGLQAELSAKTSQQELFPSGGSCRGPVWSPCSAISQASVAISGGSKRKKLAPRND
jgi:multidrug efflux pump subunit AcrA (membrane-fusion protein)